MVHHRHSGLWNTSQTMSPYCLKASTFQSYLKSNPNSSKVPPPCSRHTGLPFLFSHARFSPTGPLHPLCPQSGWRPPIASQLRQALSGGQLAQSFGHRVLSLSFSSPPVIAVWCSPVHFVCVLSFLFSKFKWKFLQSRVLTCLVLRGAHHRNPLRALEAMSYTAPAPQQYPKSTS